MIVRRLWVIPSRSRRRMREGENDQRRYQVLFIIIDFIVFSYSFLHTHTICEKVATDKKEKEKV